MHCTNGLGHIDSEEWVLARITNGLPRDKNITAAMSQAAKTMETEK
jgi:hypothetical protein